MKTDSLKRSPTFPVLWARSEPARSTKWNLEYLKPEYSTKEKKTIMWMQFQCTLHDRKSILRVLKLSFKPYRTWLFHGLRRCYTVQFPQQLATQHWKMFLLQLPKWGATPCNAIWATCNDSCRESLAKLATGAPGSVVGRIYKEINARSGKIALQVAGGVLHCAMAVESCYESRTGCYFVQRCAHQKKMRCKLQRYPVTPSNSSATCNATPLRCKLL